MGNLLHLAAELLEEIFSYIIPRGDFDLQMRLHCLRYRLIHPQLLPVIHTCLFGTVRLIVREPLERTFSVFRRLVEIPAIASCVDNLSLHDAHENTVRDWREAPHDVVLGRRILRLLSYCNQIRSLKIQLTTWPGQPPLFDGELPPLHLPRLRRVELVRCAVQPFLLFPIYRASPELSNLALDLSQCSGWPFPYDPLCPPDEDAWPRLQVTTLEISKANHPMSRRLLRDLPLEFEILLFTLDHQHSSGSLLSILANMRHSPGLRTLELTAARRISPDSIARFMKRLKDSMSGTSISVDWYEGKKEKEAKARRRQKGRAVGSLSELADLSLAYGELGFVSSADYRGSRLN